MIRGSRDSQTPSVEGRLYAKRRALGITLLELMVTGSLFGLFTGMVASALVMAQRTQDKTVVKLDAIRHASLAEDLLARDIEAARFSSRVTVDNLPLPSGSLRPTAEQPLMVARLRQDPSSSHDDATEEVVAVYWFEPHPQESLPVTADSDPPSRPGKLRRTLFDAASMAPVEGESEHGRVLARDVRDFQVASDSSAGVWLTRVDLWVNSVGHPITCFVASESPPGIN